MPGATAQPHDIFIGVNRDTGGLTIASGDDDCELLVDDRLCGVVRMDGAKIRADRVNRIIDGGLNAVTPNWRIGDIGSEIAVGRNFSPDWTLESGNTAYAAAAAGPGESPVVVTYFCPVEESCDIAVLPGETYVFQAYFGVHRARAKIRFTFTDTAGAAVKSAEAMVAAEALGGRSLAGYAFQDLVAEAPGNAARLRIELVKDITLTGTDSFLFFAHPALYRSRQPAGYEHLHDHLPGELAVRMFAGTIDAIHVCDIPIPDEALDGGWHRVAIRSRRTGESRAVPVALPDSIKASAVIQGLENTSLVCSLTMPPNWRSPVGLSLWIDGQPSPGRYWSDPQSDSLRLPLPLSACDGRPHVFAVRLGISGQLLGQHACVAPLSLTPWDALQHYSGMPLPAHLAPLASYRYASLATPRPPLAASGPSLTELHDILVEGFERPRRAYRPLPFPVVESPDVSIVIPVHDKFDVTYACLAALQFAVTRVSFEVIVVDDGSSDSTLLLDRIAPGVTVVRNATPLGFVGACNAGALKARGGHIVFLNNDTEPTAYWLDELLFAFENFEDVGLAGAKLIYPDGALQEAGGIVWETGDPWNYGRRANPHDPRFSYSRACDYLSGAAIMIPARLWHEVGGFSQEFMPAYFEDTDLAFKVRLAGKRVVFVPHAVVVHHEGLSNGTDQSAATGLKRFQEINRPKFKRKWASLFEGHGKVGHQVDLAKDRGIRKRVLFIDYELPQLDRDAGSYAAIQEIRMFQALGCKITFLPLNMAYLGRHTEFLQRLGVETIHAPFASSAASFLQSRGAEFDLVYITRYGVAEQVTGLVRTNARQAKVVVNVADLHFLRQIRDAISERSPDRMNEALQTRNAEIAALGRADLILTYSPVEQAVITSHIANGPKAAIVPWVTDPVAAVAPFKARRDIAFFGGYRHYPNVNAVKFFVTDVMPLLRRASPGIRFRIYGSHVPPEVESLAGEDVIVRGYVPDVSEVFETCRVFVAPLLTGAGMKGKVLDCISHGVPSVLSPIAAEGIGLRDGHDAIIATRAEEWVAGIARIYDDEAAWTAMSESAQEFARRHYSFERGVIAMSDALATIDVVTTTGKPALCARTARAAAPRYRRADTTDARAIPRL